jgi:hypothetical protein
MPDKQIIHIRNDSADGKAVAIAQARMRRWHEAGYAVAPVPVTWEAAGYPPSREEFPEHPQGLPCPVCSPQITTKFGGRCAYCSFEAKYRPLPAGRGRAYAPRLPVMNVTCRHCDRPVTLTVNAGQRYQQPLITTREQLAMGLDELRAHVKAMHSGKFGQKIPRSNTDLAAWHANEHFRFHLGHIHRGPFVLVANARGSTVGVIARPLGNMTGELAVTREQLKAEFLANAQLREGERDAAAAAD